jgi:hypothetical protein
MMSYDEIRFPLKVARINRVTCGHGETEAEIEVLDSNGHIVLKIPGYYDQPKTGLAEELVAVLNRYGRL